VDQPQALYLLEDALELWVAVLNQVPSLPASLLEVSDGHAF